VISADIVGSATAVGPSGRFDGAGGGPPALPRPPPGNCPAPCLANVDTQSVETHNIVVNTVATEIRLILMNGSLEECTTS
jgi:hypothetical protein